MTGNWKFEKALVKREGEYQEDKETLWILSSRAG
jgi:hypothetical protein